MQAKKASVIKKKTEEVSELESYFRRSKETGEKKMKNPNRKNPHPIT